MHPIIDKLLRKLRNVCSDYNHGRIDLTTAHVRIKDILQPRNDFWLGREPTDKEIRLLLALMVIYAVTR